MGRLQAVDGDSLVGNGERLRLRGIDAPEFAQICTKAGKPWDCGKQAKRALASLLSGGKVVCQGGQRDKYDRLLVTCRNGALDINREQVRQGMAVAFGDYQTEEDRARDGKRGLWAGEFVSPSEWRARHKPGADREAPHFFTFF